MNEEILNKMKLLKKEFYRIQSRNWILSQSKGYGGAGQTLEFLLNKSIDRDILPDYNGIELKTRQENSEPYVGLFSMALDNMPLRMKFLYEHCGWPSKDNPEFKVLYLRINNQFNRCSRRFSYKLFVNYINKVVELKIYDHYNEELIKEPLSWSFKHLQLRLETKLSYLAFVNVKRYFEWTTKKTYFKYEDIIFYKLKNFSEFLKLLEVGKIVVNIKITYYKTEEKKGNMFDKGTTFEINYNDIDFLFDRINISIN